MTTTRHDRVGLNFAVDDARIVIYNGEGAEPTTIAWLESVIPGSLPHSRGLVRWSLTDFRRQGVSDSRAEAAYWAVWAWFVRSNNFLGHYRRA